LEKKKKTYEPGVLLGGHGEKNVGEERKIEVT